jgi:hypothetical protein
MGHFLAPQEARIFNSVPGRNMGLRAQTNALTKLSRLNDDVMTIF